MKKYATGATSGATTLWSSYGTSGYKGSIAITDDGDIYVSSNYQYNYYSFYNWDDKIWIHENDGGILCYGYPENASLSSSIVFTLRL